MSEQMKSSRGPASVHTLRTKPTGLGIFTSVARSRRPGEVSRLSAARESNWRHSERRVLGAIAAAGFGAGALLSVFRASFTVLVRSEEHTLNSSHLGIS